MKCTGCLSNKGGGYMRLSNYARVYEIDGEYVLFNTINKALVKLQPSYISNGEIIDEFPLEYKNMLTEMGYFISDYDAYAMISNVLERDNKLIISVEVGLSCNMRCPYCYQGQDKIKRTLKDDDIQWLRIYYEEVEKRIKYDEIVLKVLGGEPTIMWYVSEKVINMTRDFCKSTGKKMNLMIDTNCVKVDQILKLEEYETLLLTVPLTYRECHNNIRKLSTGESSYDRIIENLNKIYSVKPKTRIVLRYNTDLNNIVMFGEYVSQIKSELDFLPIIDISYTTEIGGGQYKNKLTYEQYKIWKSSDAIDILADNNMPIMVSPLMSLDRCQYRSKYSLKLFSDGTIGQCAMDFFNKKRTRFKDICNDIGIIEEGYSKREEEYEKCKKCKSFFVCGCGYNLPCIKSLGYEECENDGNYMIDLEKFIEKYLYYKKNGKADLFVGFNGNLVIR